MIHKKSNKEVIMLNFSFQSGNKYKKIVECKPVIIEVQDIFSDRVEFVMHHYPNPGRVARRWLHPQLFGKWLNNLANG